MSKKNNLDQIERRVQAAAMQDGLMEMIIGVYLLLMTYLVLTNPSLMPFSLLALIILIPLYERLKQREIYPRIGYVKLPQEEETDVKGILITCFLGLALMLALIPLLRWWLGAERGWELWFQHVVPGFVGVLLAFGPLYLSQTYGVRRGYTFAALSVILGIALPFMGSFSGYDGVGWLCFVLGILYTVTGGLIFIRFLRRYPVEEVPDVPS